MQQKGRQDCCNSSLLGVVCVKDTREVEDEMDGCGIREY